MFVLKLAEKESKLTWLVSENGRNKSLVGQSGHCGRVEVRLGHEGKNMPGITLYRGGSSKKHSILFDVNTIVSLHLTSDALNAFILEISSSRCPRPARK